MRCDSCTKTIKGRPQTTVTGRSLCPSCHDTLTGLAAGVIASGGGVGPAIATAGVFTRLREWRRGRDA